MVTDPIADYLTRIRNAQMANHRIVEIPASNLKNLMLKEEVAAAVQAGKFHIWAVKTIEEGIEILTGVKAGKLPENERIRFEPDSVFDLVNRRFLEFSEILHESAAPRWDGRRRRGYARRHGA